MKTDNAVLATAVDSINSQAAEKVRQQMVIIIVNIETERGLIKVADQRIKDNQAQVIVIEGDILTVESILGRPLSQEPNFNERTVSEVVQKLVESRQDSVKARTQPLVQAIANDRDAIKRSEKNIADYLDKLHKMEAPSLTVEQVTA